MIYVLDIEGISEGGNTKWESIKWGKLGLGTGKIDISIHYETLHENAIFPSLQLVSFQHLLRNSCAVPEKSLMRAGMYIHTHTHIQAHIHIYIHMLYIHMHIHINYMYINFIYIKNT